MTEPLQLEGRNLVLEALESGHTPVRILIEASAPHEGKMKKILELAAQSRVPVKTVAREELRRMSRTGIHQGVIAFIDRLGPALTLTALLRMLEEKSEDPFLLVLCHVVLEHNLGALLRSSGASGVNGIVLPGRDAARLGPQAIRVSAGAALHVPVVHDGLMSAFKTLKRRGVWLIGAEAGTGKPYYEADLTGPVALVIGGEDQGLSEPIRRACDFVVHIPMVGRVPSLNVSVAGAILMFERVRQIALKLRGGKG